MLVIDDNVEVAQTIGWMLEEMGHHYSLVHDGRLALQAAREFRPDAILLDIGLPVMDGYAVCRAFRQDELFKDALIIAQTGWGQQKDKSLASEAGSIIIWSSPSRMKIWSAFSRNCRNHSGAQRFVAGIRASHAQGLAVTKFG